MQRIIINYFIRKNIVVPFSVLTQCVRSFSVSISLYLSLPHLPLPISHSLIENIVFQFIFHAWFDLLLNIFSIAVVQCIQCILHAEFLEWSIQTEPWILMKIQIFSFFSFTWIRQRFHRYYRRAFHLHGRRRSTNWPPALHTKNTVKLTWNLFGSFAVKESKCSINGIICMCRSSLQ